MTDSSAWLITTSFTPATRTSLMNALFGASGIRLNFVRIPIGGSDFSATGAGLQLRRSAFRDRPTRRSRSSRSRTTSHTSCRCCAQMLAINPTDRDVRGTVEPAAVDEDQRLGRQPQRHRLSAQRRPRCLAQYFVKFLRAYASPGIPIDAITPQNEPGAPSAFPGLNLSAAGEAQFIAQYLVPALRAARLHPKIYGFDRGCAVVLRTAADRSAQRAPSSRASPGTVTAVRHS